MRHLVEYFNSQLFVHFSHLIEGLDRRENLIQRPLLEVVVVNTV